MCEKIQRAVKQSAKMGLPQVSPYLLFFAGEAVARGVCEHTFVLSQEIASCEKKASGKMRSSQRRNRLLAQPARARNKSCAAKAVVRGVCEHIFVHSIKCSS